MTLEKPITDAQQTAMQVAIWALLSGRHTHINWGAFDAERWHMLADLAESLQVAQLVHQALRAEGAPEVPAEVREQLNRSYRYAAIVAMVRQRELTERLLPAFAEAQIPIMLLKGAALAHTLYPAPGLRPMGDFDLLAMPEHVDAAIERLLQLGYTEKANAWSDTQIRHHRVFLRQMQSGVITVELHWNIVGSSSDWYAPPVEWFWAHRETQTIYDTQGRRLETLVLDPTALLLHLTAHLALQHGITVAKTIWFYDIHLLLTDWADQIEWELVQDRARAWDWTAALHTALSTTRARFGTRVPALDAPRLTGQGAALVEVRRSGLTNKRMLNVLAWLGSKRDDQRLRMAFRLLFPEPEYMRQRYQPQPEWLWPLYYPVRWYRGLVGVVDVLRSHIGDRSW